MLLVAFRDIWVQLTLNPKLSGFRVVRRLLTAYIRAIRAAGGRSWLYVQARLLKAKWCIVAFGALRGLVSIWAACRFQDLKVMGLWASRVKGSGLRAVEGWASRGVQGVTVWGLEQLIRGLRSLRQESGQLESLWFRALKDCIGFRVTVQV